MPDLTPRPALAKMLEVSDHTMRRRLNGLVNRGMILRPIGKGQKQMFTAEDVAKILEGLRCPYTCAAEVKFGTPEGRSALVVKVSRSRSSAQERVAAMMRKPSRETKSAASAPRLLRGRRDAHDASP